MALAEFTHHSSRGQRTARAWEEVENATHDGLRAQKTPPPGERPGCLPDPGPQRSDRTVRHSAGEAPSLLPPLLADAAADVVDHSSLAFLLRASLRQRRKEEEEEEARKVEMEQVLAVKEQWRARRKVLKDEFMALSNLESRLFSAGAQVAGTLGMPWTPHDLPPVPLRGRRRRGKRSSRRPGADSFLPVVDVSVIIYDKFQQFLLGLLVFQL